MTTKQKISSAKTSINSKKLPAIYNKIDWDSLKRDGYKAVLDIGAGKYVDHIRNFLSFYGFEYFPMDPYNQSEEVNAKAEKVLNPVVICSNVLNVIEEDDIVTELHRTLRNANTPYFIKIHEGDKTGVGKITQNGECYQRNAKTKTYCVSSEIVYKNVITEAAYKKYITTPHKKMRDVSYIMRIDHERVLGPYHMDMVTIFDKRDYTAEQVCNAINNDIPLSNMLTCPKKTFEKVFRSLMK